MKLMRLRLLPLPLPTGSCPCGGEAIAPPSAARSLECLPWRQRLPSNRSPRSVHGGSKRPSPTPTRARRRRRDAAASASFATCLCCAHTPLPLQPAPTAATRWCWLPLNGLYWYRTAAPLVTCCEEDGGAVAMRSLQSLFINCSTSLRPSSFGTLACHPSPRRARLDGSSSSR